MLPQVRPVHSTSTGQASEQLPQHQLPDSWQALAASWPQTTECGASPSMCVGIAEPAGSWFFQLSVLLCSQGELWGLAELEEPALVAAVGCC